VRLLVRQVLALRRNANALEQIFAADTRRFDTAAQQVGARKTDRGARVGVWKLAGGRDAVTSFNDTSMVSV
jgi:hypothetical protein